jgi:hypothetical protein
MIPSRQCRAKEFEGTLTASARSRRRPEVQVCYTTRSWQKWLVDELAIYDARNLARDQIFRDHAVSLEVRPYWYQVTTEEHVGRFPRREPTVIREGFALELLSVTIYPD